MHAHRGAEVGAEVEEGDRELARALGKQRIVGAEPDLAMGIVVDAREHVGRRRGRGRIGLGSQGARPFDQGVEAERLGLAQLDPAGRQHRWGNAQRGQGGGGGGGDQQGSAVHHVAEASFCIRG
ncbi:hypothetical protein D3C81_1832020 [compost metagenome]